MAAAKNEKNAGETMMTKLRDHAKRSKDPKAGLTTEALASVAGVSLKDAYSRLWWLESKEGLLVSKGKGKAREWRLSSKGRKSMNPPAPSAEA
jgi:hypothetical protein